MTNLLPLDKDETTRTWLATACFMVAIMVVLTPAAFIDPRVLDGVSVWSKPLKFAFALAVHFVTLAVLAQFLAPESRGGRLLSRFVRISVAAALFEIVYIAFQAARGRHSHFNFTTPFETGMYALMGIGAVLLVVTAFVLGLLLLRQRDGDRSALRLGAVIGLLLAPFLTLIVTGYMSGVVYSHWIGNSVSDATGMPLLGWSREVGDLRPSHFVALHAMQILPLLGYAGDRFAPAHARAMVWAMTLFIIVATVALFIQALAGQPLWPR